MGNITLSQTAKDKLVKLTEVLSSDPTVFSVSAAHDGTSPVHAFGPDEAQVLARVNYTDSGFVQVVMATDEEGNVILTPAQLRLLGKSLAQLGDKPGAIGTWR